MNGEEKEELEEDTLVSMNIWGVEKDMLNGLEDVFTEFLGGEGRNLLKDEFYLPEAMDELRKRSGKELKIIRAHDQWMGMTYAEDKEEVASEVRKMVDQGHYSESLFGE
ncbi:MAG TPA: hypothetical protein DHM90_11905 [Clostridiaceae bacterium]|nr:hypothetical protein [Clostridiaceae bacterium]